MKIKMIEQFLLNDQQLLKFHCMQLRLHTDTRHDLCFKHNHTQNYINMIKLSLIIKMITEMKMTKDYQACDIHCNLQEIKIEANKQALVDVNESHLNLLHVHNVDVN